MITIKDIAKESGYSVGTVSRVLNGRTNVSEAAREKIVAVVDKYNFRLNENAKLLKQQSTHSIAVIVKGTQNMLFADIIERLQNMIEEKEYDFSIFYLAEQENEVSFARRICREKKPEGILFLGCDLDLFKGEFRGIEIPCVLVTNDGSELSFENVSSVSTDDRKAAEFVIDHLVEAGHKRIGVIGGDMRFSTASRYRFDGCCDAFRKHGLSFDQYVQYETGYFSLESGYNAATRLLRKMPDVTAIFAMSDVTAIGTIRAAAERNIKVPDELTVIGFDGIEIADYMIPRLTTVRQNRQTLAEKSIELILGMIERKHGAVHMTVPFTIVKGASMKTLEQKTSDSDQ